MGIEGDDPESEKARKELGIIIVVIFAMAIGTFSYFVVSNAKEQNEKQDSCRDFGGILVDKVCHKKESILYIGK